MEMGKGQWMKTYKLQYPHILLPQVLSMPKEWKETMEVPRERAHVLGSNSTDAYSLLGSRRCTVQSAEPNNRLPGVSRNIEWACQDILCTTKTCILKPLKLQNIFCEGLPMFCPARFNEADERKFIAIQKSLIANPLEHHQMLLL